MKRCSICVTLFLATRVRYDGVFFMGKERIRLVNVSKSYYSQETVTQALRKVNLTFSTGEFVAITGESGSGKSTLLHMIGGMDTFDEGEMFVDGAPTFQYDENDWEEYRCGKIGYVFQDYSLLGHYTVLDNIVGALLVMGRKKKEAEELRNSISTGDKITTIGGIVGTVVNVKDDKIVIETSADQVRMELCKWAVSTNDTANERIKAEQAKKNEEKAKAKAAKKVAKEKK